MTDSRNIDIACQCGSLRGVIKDHRRVVGGICYCRDCRAYANHLGCRDRTHDEQGGAHFVATCSDNFHWRSDLVSLSCLSLSESGLLRWYCHKCKSPVVNTPRDWRVPYLSIMAACLRVETIEDGVHFNEDMLLHRASALRKVPGNGVATFVGWCKLGGSMALSTMTGKYKNNPFFTGRDGEPVVNVQVLSGSERVTAYRA